MESSLDNKFKKTKEKFETLKNRSDNKYVQRLWDIITLGGVFSGKNNADKDSETRQKNFFIKIMEDNLDASKCDEKNNEEQ